MYVKGGTLHKATRNRNESNHLTFAPPYTRVRYGTRHDHVHLMAGGRAQI